MRLYGYIYVRRHSAYDAFNACKLGKTTNIPDRDSTYATCEIIRGSFEVVIEVPLTQMSIIERFLQHEFQKYHIKHNAGTEFYSNEIISCIEPCLQEHGITYRRIPECEILELLRKQRIRNNFQKLRASLLISRLKRSSGCYSYAPREYQNAIIASSVEHFRKNNKGLLVLTCGIGKTLISLWVAERLERHNRTVIGVPNKQLMKQWQSIITRLYIDVPLLVVSGGVSVVDIANFLESNNKRHIIITTYSSSHKVYKAATVVISTSFDFKINDECHHLTTINMRVSEMTKSYIHMLMIPCDKQLSLTATLKTIDVSNLGGNIDERGGVVSNDDTDHFGDVIERRCVLWAIQQNIICDYQIQTIVALEEQLEDLFQKFETHDENNQRLLLTAYASLKSINDGHSHHMLIYSNNKANSIQIITYIRILIKEKYFDMPDLYVSKYHSDMKSRTQSDILTNFGNSKKGIISCVYCLGEGWDFPLLDAVVFAENMTSNIRIVQSALRPCRKNADEPNKIVKIILPILNRDDWLSNNENPDMRKSREIIYQIGLEDETISQKIKVFRIEIKKSERKPTLDDHDNDFHDHGGIGEYDDELTQQLRLKTVKRTALSTTYERAKRIIADHNIKTRKEYYDLCRRDNRLSTEPETTYIGQFTNWIDYLGIQRVYYPVDVCKVKVSEYLSLHPEIRAKGLDLSKICEDLCLLDQLFPPNGLWTDYYNIHELGEIIILSKKRKTNIAL
jgi:superfamily II DNA or RNA helicase